MDSYGAIREHLPSLYRPEEGDDRLFARVLRAIGALLDELNEESSDVLRSRWCSYADRPEYDRFFTLGRELLGLPALRRNVEAELAVLRLFPYVRDLARIGALLPLPPRRDASGARDSVETYRDRLKQFVNLHRNGLGTVAALRRVVEFELQGTEGGEGRSFTVEEPAPRARTPIKITARGEPRELLGPLMRWEIVNEGMCDVLPTIYVRGSEAVPGEVDATESPLVELLSGSGANAPIGLAYRGRVPPGLSLRLRPAWRVWIGGADGLTTAESRPGASGAADPTVPGGRHEADGAPREEVTALFQSSDRVLWLAVSDGAEGGLWRHDGTRWDEIASTEALPPIRALSQRAATLLVGTELGLRGVRLFPEDGATFAVEPLPELDPALAGQAIYAINRTRAGRYWLGTERGAALLAEDGWSAALQLSSSRIRAIEEARDGTLYFGGDDGLFEHHPGAGTWYWYSGREASDQVPDWEPLTAGQSPPPDAVCVPAVSALHAEANGTLWIGTRRGLARYVARSNDGFSYRTQLEAFPDLTGARVAQIAEDERGGLWFCTDDGLFRFDGEHFLCFDDARGGWESIGTLISEAPPGQRDARAPGPVPWRYLRGDDCWQRVDYATKTPGWTTHPEQPPAAAGRIVTTIAWTDSVAADLGRWDGSSFERVSEVDGRELCVRVKPDPARALDGGLPALPRLPVGRSVWRYLSLDDDPRPPETERPWWNREGRLWPPPTMEQIYPGRYDELTPAPPDSRFDGVTFAYAPCARLWFEWSEHRPFSFIVRLHRRDETDVVDPSVIDWVWQGIQLVRPAGVAGMLAIDDEIIRGNEHG